MPISTNIPHLIRQIHIDTGFSIRAKAIQLVHTFSIEVGEDIGDLCSSSRAQLRRLMWMKVAAHKVGVSQSTCAYLYTSQSPMVEAKTYLSEPIRKLRLSGTKFD
ncbi:hypothetical protein Naga_100668g5 [Nannochloropsis gaditana]|uniref:Uncharacterized protein n=1 Tax=Nannochloropsis gaditana TaxID=72520 RepID=W7TSD9_9STRA|nr:hypothetical protein Naga_100668g5 [Nannochloropsis gaditana]